MRDIIQLSRDETLSETTKTTETLMDVYNIDTSEIFTLRMIDPATGLDWSIDWVDGAIPYNSETDQYEADTATLDYWVAQMCSHQAVFDLIHEMRRDYGTDAVNDVLASTPRSDFEAQPYEIFNALTQRFGIFRKLDLTRP